MFEKIPKSTSSEHIVHQIIQKIKSGTIRPGEKLPTEKEMSGLFGVCRASVREATRALTMMGYIDVYQGKGAFLRQDRPDTRHGKVEAAVKAAGALDLLDVRTSLETKIVSLACERATPGQMRNIEATVERMQNAIGCPGNYYAADRDFHMALAKASNNAVMLELMTLICAKMAVGREQLSGLSDVDFTGCSQTAREIARHIRAGDKEAAIYKMMRHLKLLNYEIADIMSNTHGEHANDDLPTTG